MADISTVASLALNGSACVLGLIQSCWAGSPWVIFLAFMSGACCAISATIARKERERRSPIGVADQPAAGGLH
ncbi:hypothetical protein [Methylobacterium nodulans]|uniref:Uncharacterized protein n=1 Tax=Methylobacterium nodulans (strain LMG 21967 / CNCM I-2342 / ORS 2060) TaxID=460265 RepID=B8IDS5_METNO|nr:hypothetical protein [Methylobacterium nodulans]ACL55647.1 hypothetical protein Mnod_0611 [Methylobacterium nodulans ORS 2060]